MAAAVRVRAPIQQDAHRVIAGRVGVRPIDVRRLTPVNVEIGKGPETAAGFEFVPKRWNVEQPFCWASNDAAALPRIGKSQSQGALLTSA